MQSEIAIGRIVKVREHPRYNSVYLYGRIQRTTPQFYVIAIEFKDTPNLDVYETSMYDVTPYHTVMRVSKRIAMNTDKYNMTVLEHYPNASPVRSTEVTNDYVYVSRLINLLENATAEDIQQLQQRFSDSYMLLDRILMLADYANSTNIPISPNSPIHNIITNLTMNRSNDAIHRLIEICDELKSSNKMTDADYDSIVSFANKGEIYSVLDVFEDLNEKEKISEGDYLRACNAMRDIQSF